MHKRVILGPFFSASSGTPGSGTVFPLNVSVEWAGSSEGVRLPLLQVCPEGSSQIRLHHIVVRADQIPDDVVSCEAHIVTTPDGGFVPLEAVIVALYQNHQVDRDIRDVLRELGEFISLQNSVREHIPPEGLLLPDIEQEGYRISNAIGECETVLIEIGWRSPGSTNLFHVANCQFHLHGKEVLTNAWIQTVGAPGVANLLAAKFQALFPATPNLLLTPRGMDLITSVTSI